MSDINFSKCSNCGTNLGEYPVTFECPHCTGRLELWRRQAGFWAWLFGDEKKVS